MTRAMIDGSVDSDGIRWARCPACGDSQKNRTKAHMLIDAHGKSYCFKCGHTSSLNTSQLIDISLGYVSIDEALDGWDLSDKPDKEQDRFSYLDTYEDVEVPSADCFEMKDVFGRRVGWHVRYERKRFKNEGERGIGYWHHRLLSTPASPLVLVEGPYDVVKPHYVCAFGSITSGVLRKYFRFQYVWLFPDPDVVDTKAKRQRLYEKVIVPAQEALVHVQGVMLAPGDPDEVQDHQIVSVPVEEWKDSSSTIRKFIISRTPGM